MPARPRVAETAATDHSGPVHLPERDLTAVVLKKNIGQAVTSAVEITGTYYAPTRSRVTEVSAPNYHISVQFPDINLSIVVLKNNVCPVDLPRDAIHNREISIPHTISSTIPPIPDAIPDAVPHVTSYIVKTVSIIASAICCEC